MIRARTRTPARVRRGATYWPKVVALVGLTVTAVAAGFLMGLSQPRPSDHSPTGAGS